MGMRQQPPWISPAELGYSFSFMVDKVSDYAIFLISPDGIILTWNKAAEAMKGYTADEAIGIFIGQLYTEEDQKRHHPHHNLRMAAEKGTFQEETWRQKKDGSLFWALAEIIAIRNPDGELTGFCKLTRDITERKELQDKITLDKERAQTTLDAIGEAVISIDTQGRIDFLNPKAEQLTGWLNAEAHGQPLAAVFNLIDHNGRPVPDHELISCIQSGHAFHSNVSSILLSRDGSCYEIEDTARSIFMPGERITGGVIVFRDVTRRKVVEKALKDADERKDEFLAMLGHELRNPLAPISAAADLLSIAALEPLRVQETSEIITRQVQHMTHLIDDLLDVSRVTRGLIVLERNAQDIKAIVADAIEQVRPLIDARSHRLTVDLAAESVLVNGDKKRLVQVIANLLSNAAKYTPVGGHIAVQMEVVSDRVSLTIRDNGIGMAPELVTRAFQLFAQAERSSDRSQGGLGIGLALVKSLVKLHDGTISAYSRGIGQGSTFTIALPRMHEVVQPRQLREEDISNATIAALRIMVVDDNADAAKLLAMFLETLGHAVQVEYHAQKALELSSHFVPDVCLLDIGLPGFDGYELARRLRSDPKTRDAILIAVTGYGQKQDIEKAFAAGFNHHLVKPVDRTKLVELVRRIAQQRKVH